MKPERIARVVRDELRRAGVKKPDVLALGPLRAGDYTVSVDLPRGLHFEFVVTATQLDMPPPSQGKDELVRESLWEAMHAFRLLARAMRTEMP